MQGEQMTNWVISFNKLITQMAHLGVYITKSVASVVMSEVLLCTYIRMIINYIFISISVSRVHYIFKT